eukprot:TRINITY_DN7652_c0_g1_i1.p1 TRINITY_DN7652_c0_g1~~TRINITY_DN7652_c0_g1_i1.p1  ORF type:complete len:633 (+),score=171.68 TRINITY_DN7652_c0_g1_i1:77-1975(+)
MAAAVAISTANRPSAAGRLTKLLQLCPQQGDVNVKFIVVRKKGELSDASEAAPNSGRRLTELVVADASGSATLQLQGRAAPEDADLLAPGEIFSLERGETCLDAGGRLCLRVGNDARLQRMGFLTMAFELLPQLSAQPWETVKQKLRAAAAPAKEERAETRRPPKAAAGSATGQEASAAVAGPAKGVPKKQSSNAKHRCFLCDDTDHDVFNCPEQAKGVVFMSPCMDKLAKNDARASRLEAALNNAGLTVPIGYRWYKKEDMPGAMYARFANEKAASLVLQHRGDLRHEGEAIRAYPIRKSLKRQRDADAANEREVIRAVKQKAAASASLESRQQGPPGQAAGAPLVVAKQPRQKGGPQEMRSGPTHEARKQCFLCGQADHELPACPARARCLLACRDHGVPQGYLDPAGKKLLEAVPRFFESELGMKLLHHRWNRSVCYVQLESEDEVEALVSSLGKTGKVTIAGETLTIRRAVSTRTDAAKKRALKASRVGLTPAVPCDLEPNHDEEETKCPLCGAEDHRLPSCPVIARGLHVRASAMAASADHGEAEVMAAIFEAGIKAPERLHWQTGGLYLVMASQDDAKQLREYAVLEGLHIGGDMASVDAVAERGKAAQPAAEGATAKQKRKKKQE